MRPNTLAEAVQRIQTGASWDVALAEFVDTFDLAPTVEARYATIEEQPILTNDKRLDALVGGVAEYLAKQTGWVGYRLGPQAQLVFWIVRGIRVPLQTMACANI